MAFINQAVTVLQTLVIALGAGPVSYTHLDVYKRQVYNFVGEIPEITE